MCESFRMSSKTTSFRNKRRILLGVISNYASKHSNKSILLKAPLLLFPYNVLWTIIIWCQKYRFLMIRKWSLKRRLFPFKRFYGYGIELGPTLHIYGAFWNPRRHCGMLFWKGAFEIMKKSPKSLALAQKNDVLRY